MPPLAAKVLGAGQHVGKSCNIVYLNGTNILLDCGIQVFKKGASGFPDLESLFFHTPCGHSRKKRKVDETTNFVWDNPNNNSPRSLIDYVLITHFHIDHIGALPYLTEVLGYDGPILMTEPTLELGRVLLMDCWCGLRNTIVQPDAAQSFIGAATTCEPNHHGQHMNEKSGSQQHCRNQTEQLSSSFFLDNLTSPPVKKGSCNSSSSSSREITSSCGTFYGDVSMTPDMLSNCLSKVKIINLNEKIKLGCSSIHLTALPAGHVFGASMFWLEDDVSGQSVLYTGDYTVSSEHFIQNAKIPRLQPTLTISESTYGGQIRDSKKNAEFKLCLATESVIRKRGNVLIPISGVGRAQEYAALLSGHWDRCGLTAPIFLAKGLIQKGLDVLRNQPTASTIDWNKLRHICVSDANSVLDFSKREPCVFLCAPKTMNHHPSLDILKAWGTSPNNLILITGFSIPGTVAYQVLHGMKEILYSDSEPKIKFKAKMRYLSLAGHADSLEIQQFFQAAPPLVSILVHGEIDGMRYLSNQLRKILKRPVCLPVNGEVVVVELPSPIAMPLSLQSFYKSAAIKQRARRIEESDIDAQANKGDRDPQLPNFTLRNLIHSGIGAADIWLYNLSLSAQPAALDLDELIKSWCPQLSDCLDELGPVVAERQKLHESLKDAILHPPNNAATPLLNGVSSLCTQ